MYLESTTNHYIFHYKPGSPAEHDIEIIKQCQENCYSRITKTLNVHFPQSIHYWLCESPEDVGRLYGDDEPCNGAAREPDTVYAVYNEHIKCIGAHEDAHLISYTIAVPESVFLREGLAMFFDSEWWGEPNEVWVRKFIENNTLPSIRKLFSDEYFYEYDCAVTYPVAGEFTGYLINTFGIEKYLDLYRYKGLDWHKAFFEAFEMTIDEAVSEFILKLS